VVERLAEEIVRAGGAGLRLNLLADDRRIEQERRAGGTRIGAHSSADLEAVDARHHDVNQSDLGGIGSCQVQRLEAAGGPGHFKALLAEDEL
jgi:hypothetical protein